MANQERPVISWEQWQVLEGNMYQVFFEAALADDATITFAFKTPASTTKEIHMWVDYGSEIGGTMTILEAATWTASSGTVIVPINLNRLSTNTSEILGNETSTAFETSNEMARDVGTTILTTNATKLDLSAAYNDGNYEAKIPIILKASTTYVVRFIAEGASNFAYLKLRWCEYLPNVI